MCQDRFLLICLCLENNLCATLLFLNVWPLTVMMRSNPRSDAAKLKYDGVRCLFEDAASDILLLLDTCAIPDPPASGSHGLKQAIAACLPDQTARSAPGRSFTTILIEALHKLEAGRPFSAQRLHEEILSMQQRHSNPLQAPNGIHIPSLHSHTPFFFTLTPDKGQSLTLAPMAGRRLSTAMDVPNARGNEEQLIDQESITDLRFDEARILVCTTFVGDASPDMSSFRQWLDNTPAMGTKIAVEGMFLGPPTMLLISMPHSVWNVVQHDKVCCFLGYISSRNMLHIYNKLVEPSLGKPVSGDGGDCRASLGSKDAHAVSVRGAREVEARDAHFSPTDSRDDKRLSILSHGGASRSSYQPLPPGGGARKPNENEGSQEMREAAEQLKALSHVRHRSDEGTNAHERPRTTLPNGVSESRNGEHEAYDSGIDDSTFPEGKTGLNRVKVPRRAPTKHDTQCSHCSHAPFRDSSSLRKHVAAAHTRPFPCAFSFAGCTSTFGSKNEWKRHITSQHLCLQFYRCSQCPQSAAEGKGNEFNRKDLFTQHLRRMHAPFHIKRAVSKGDPKLQAEWDSHVKGMQQSCLVQRRHPPQKSACPNPDCQSIFEGPGSWDEWTEHVGRHMEKSEGNTLGVDGLLVDWALKEKIIEPFEQGRYRLVASTGIGGNASGGESGHSIDRRGSLIHYDEAHQLADKAVKLSETAASAMDVDR